MTLHRSYNADFPVTVTEPDGRKWKTRIVNQHLSPGQDVVLTNAEGRTFVKNPHRAGLVPWTPPVEPEDADES